MATKSALDQLDHGSVCAIYYGWLIAHPDGTPNREAHMIAEAQPDAVIVFLQTFEPVFTNLSPQVVALLQAAGVRIFTHIDTAYGERPLEHVVAETHACVDHGVDGIFFDRVTNFWNVAATQYYRTLAGIVRGQQRTVIANTGIAVPGEAVMEIADILMVEHAWRELLRYNRWYHTYPPARFMGNTSNEQEAEVHFDYPVTLETAIRDTREAWQGGIGHHFSTDRYIHLPPWFPKYLAALQPRPRFPTVC